MSAIETTRRALLAGAAAVGAELMPYAREVEAKPVAVDHPDAELIALASQLAGAKTQRDTIDRQLDEAYDGHTRPQIPEALYWRRSDFIEVWIDRNGRLAQYGEGDAARWVYEDESEIDSLRESLAAMNAAHVANNGVGTSHRAIARTEEIIAAHEAWAFACRRAADQDGITALEEASRREDQHVERLQLRLVATRARTAEGFAVKARTAAPSVCTDLHRLESEMLPNLIAERGGWEGLWLYSLLVDGIHLDEATPAVSTGDLT